jgi:hypothetical protein
MSGGNLKLHRSVVEAFNERDRELGVSKDAAKRIDP